MCTSSSVHLYTKIVINFAGLEIIRTVHTLCSLRPGTRTCPTSDEKSSVVLLATVQYTKFSVCLSSYLAQSVYMVFDTVCNITVEFC